MEVLELKYTLENLADYMRQAFVQELIDRGHQASGKLIRSVEVKVDNFVKGLAITGYAEFYGKFVESGRRPGVKRVPLDALIEWLKQKNFSEDANRIRGIAFAIQATIFRDGIKQSPWIEETVNKNEREITNILEEAVERKLELWLIEIIQSQS